MPIAILPVTLVTAAACALLNLWLMVRVGRVRMREKVSIGDGGNEPLIRRMRAHANFVENAPFVLALVLILELTRGPSVGLWLAAGAFLIGRLLHGLGMDGGRFGVGRSIGVALTMLVLAALAIWAIVTVYQSGAVPGAVEVEAVPAVG